MKKITIKPTDKKADQRKITIIHSLLKSDPFMFNTDFKYITCENLTDKMADKLIHVIKNDESFLLDNYIMNERNVYYISDQTMKSKQTSNWISENNLHLLQSLA